MHFKKTLSIWTEFIPQLLFMQCIFGYLCFTIIYKWSIPWYEPDANGNPRNSPPGLLNLLIYMFLQPGKVEKANELFPHQVCLFYVLFLSFLLRGILSFLYTLQ